MLRFRRGVTPVTPAYTNSTRGFCMAWSGMRHAIEGVMIEIEYTRPSLSCPSTILRRQLLQVPDGWTLSAVEIVGVGPTSLRGYSGGWQFPSRVYRTRGAAERAMARNGWSPSK